MTPTIRETTRDDIPVIADIQHAAFGRGMEARLTQDLLNDPTASPCLSLLALDGAGHEARAQGHILFTAARVEGTATPLRATVLAPVGVRPVVQGTGIGGALIRAGLDRLRADGIDLVVLAGHPSYYPRFGFRPAFPMGLEAPIPFPPEYADAWMALILNADLPPHAIRGCVAWAETFDRPDYQPDPPQP